MGSPLRKRFPRELRANAGKYIGLFVMMVIAIGLSSGFLAAASSIETIIDGMDEQYAIEDGRITLDERASTADLAAASTDAAKKAAGAAEFTELFSMDLPLAMETGSQNATVRVYQQRERVDLAAYAAGTAPQGDFEVALDRVFCEHNDVSVGDTVEIDGQAFTVCGIMTLPDYSALFEKNSDFVFNSITFTVAEVAPSAFDALKEGGNSPTYTYAFTFANENATAAERTDAEKAITKKLTKRDVEVSDLVDKSVNQGIGYPADDVSGDQTMWETLVMLLIVIMAFMFVVLTGSTIEAESAIIGTLLASGWRKREITLHYLALPCFTGLAAAVVGNLLGYIGLSSTMQGLYYNSYSLPPYVATWSWHVFFLTTAAPLALLIGITALGLAYKMRATPLQFLRHETTRRRGKHGLALPERLGFPTRFRLRVFITNIGNFVILFLGISFASMLLLFGMCILPTMENYADSLRSDVVAEHLYTLKAPLELERSAEQQEQIDAAKTLAKVKTASDMTRLGLTVSDLEELAEKAEKLEDGVYAVNKRHNSDATVAQAEKYATTSLDYDRGDGNGTESVSVYGVQRESRYWEGLSLARSQVAASRGFMEKFGFELGDTVTLCDTYADENYEITINSVYGSESSIAVYLRIENFNTMFGNDANYFNGWASDEPLKLQSRFVASEMTPADMDKIGAQMTNSMGDMMNMIMAVAVLIFLVFMYLLTKTVIDRSARAISYLKVFGYRNREINRLYIRSITWTVAVSLVACIPLIIGALTAIFEAMLMSYSGHIVIYVPGSAYISCIAAGLASYAVVAVLHTRRIKHVPLEIALKVQE